MTDPRDNYQIGRTYVLDYGGTHQIPIIVNHIKENRREGYIAKDGSKIAENTEILVSEDGTGYYPAKMLKETDDHESKR